MSEPDRLFSISSAMRGEAQVEQVARTLKDFSQYQVAGRDRLVTEESIQSVCL